MARMLKSLLLILLVFIATVHCMVEVLREEEQSAPESCGNGEHEETDEERDIRQQARIDLAEQRRKDGEPDGADPPDGGGDDVNEREDAEMIMQEYDKDKDGKVSFQEMDSVSEGAQQMMDAFKAADVDGDNHLTLIEIPAFQRGISKDDADASQGIKKDETPLEKAMREYAEGDESQKEQREGPQEPEEVMEEYDVDKDGKISLFEIIGRDAAEAAEEVNSGSNSATAFSNALGPVYKAFIAGDTDGDKHLDLAEIPSFMVALAKVMGRTDLPGVVDEANEVDPEMDADGNEVDEWEKPDEEL